jgi:hypothetical protein
MKYIAFIVSVLPTLLFADNIKTELHTVDYDIITDEQVQAFTLSQPSIHQLDYWIAHPGNSI